MKDNKKGDSMLFFIRLGILAALLLAPSIAFAADTGWYVGADVGSSQVSEPPPLYTDSNYFRIGNVVSYSSDVSNQRSTAIQLDAGYWINPYVGLQAAYVDLGQSTRLARGSFSFECQTCFGSTPFIESVRVKVNGVSFSVTPRMPLSDDFELLGRAGVLWNRVTYDEDSNGTLFSYQNINGTLFVQGPVPAKHTSVDPTLGISLGWKPVEHWEVLLGWDEYFGLGESSLGTFNVSVVSVGVQYHF